jgi:hypothetical protein
MAHLPKQDSSGRKWRIAVPRWLVILGIVAVIALIAGFVTFGGGNMGH